MLLDLQIIQLRFQLKLKLCIKNVPMFRRLVVTLVALFQRRQGPAARPPRLPVKPREGDAPALQDSSTGSCTP